MSEEKETPTAKPTRKMKSTDSPILNGRDTTIEDKYDSLFALTSVVCLSCKTPLVPSVAVFGKTLVELDQAAKQMHNNAVTEKRLLCLSPQFMILYSYALLDRSLIK